MNAESTEPVKQGNYIILHFINALNSGNDISIVYNQELDGPLERYKDRDDVKIEYVTWSK